MRIVDCGMRIDRVNNRTCPRRVGFAGSKESPAEAQRRGEDENPEQITWVEACSGGRQLLKILP